MIQVDDTVACIAIKPEGRKRFGCRINAGRVTSCAAIGKAFFIPNRFLEIDPLLNLFVGSQFGLCVKQSELAVALFFQEPKSATASPFVFDFRRARSKDFLYLTN